MNPLIARKGVCDPHIHIFEGKAYLYATHDVSVYPDKFCMEDWQIWSSEDLIDWKLERVIHPEDFYCGPLDQCWAVDAAYKNGKYYYYFSTGAWGVGVGVSDHPAGPFEDALSHALADYTTYPEQIPKWDPHIFQDEDGNSYLIVGTCDQEEPWDCYLIARLQEDMVHLAEPFQRIEYEGNPCPEDKPSIHKYKDKYYLTHASYYAVSDSVYGPYQHIGHFGCSNDHGAFFTWNHQTYFAGGGMDTSNCFYRASYLTVCHYRSNGEICIEPKLLEYGCGQYDASWQKINAAWYFAASRECKTEAENQEFVVHMKDGEFLYFPEVANIQKNAVLQIAACCKEQTKILIKEDSVDGKLLGSCIIEPRTDAEEMVHSCRLNCTEGKKSLYFICSGEAEIRWFAFDPDKKRYAVNPVLVKRGMGVSLSYAKSACNHQILRNLELKGTEIEMLMDGGAGGKGELVVSYECEKSPVSLELCLNGQPCESVGFPVCEGGYGYKRIPVEFCAGLNQVCFSSASYQNGSLRISMVIAETKKSSSFVYPAANGVLYPEGNGRWEGLAQWESAEGTFSGRIVKYLENPGDSVTIRNVDGGKGGTCDLAIHYCRGEQSDSIYELWINGELQQIIRFTYTGSFAVCDMENYRTKVVLKEGRKNEISLKKSANRDQGIFVDAFAVIVP